MSNLQKACFLSLLFFSFCVLSFKGFVFAKEPMTREAAFEILQEYNISYSFFDPPGIDVLFFDYPNAQFRSITYFGPNSYQGSKSRTEIPEFDMRLARAIACFPEIHYLGVLSGTAGDREMKFLNKMQSLRTLSLDGLHISDITANRIGKIKTLETIRISTSHITIIGIERMASLPNLSELLCNFSTEAVPDDCRNTIIQSIQENNPNLQIGGDYLVMNAMLRWIPCQREVSLVPIQGTEHQQDEVNDPSLEELENDDSPNGANQEIDPEE